MEIEKHLLTLMLLQILTVKVSIHCMEKSCSDIQPNKENESQKIMTT